MQSRQDPERPTGRDAVRRSILRAARHHFAREGSRASLRDIADTAGVNPGLIHRHFGRKDQLVSQVIEHTLQSSKQHVADNAAGTMRSMFLDSTTQTDFVRMIAWMALESGPDGASPLAFAPDRTIAEVRRAPGTAAPGEPHPDPDLDARLMTALTVIYGWSVFSREMLSAFDVGEDRRAEFEHRIADLLAELTAPTPKATR
ncbi:TetR/AcrR family transcriptional regulator [Tomitella fengzijianii]|uniref:TetR/AcrR family transcriptional regulator n=1 Tax=Tomitella fengzijianii TaxID=2597660 RepID=A0A516WZX1_9ACTN|nr:TetR/AcrR family transcriptional regulator [Tomitella fengzijianii]QDQ96406.1 TetR/AcrR family transcriptional regulator [Tomitella fengzijianii]